MAIAVLRTIPAPKVTNVLECIEDALLDDLHDRFLSEEDRVTVQTLEVILTTAVEDGDYVVVRPEVVDLMLHWSWADHTDFVGGVECIDCRATFFLRKNGSRCPECKGLL